MANDELDLLIGDYVLEKAGQPARELSFSLDQAARKKPDFEAELQKLSTRVGVPVETARALPEETRRQAKLKEIDSEFLRQNFPQTAAFIAPQENADVASDDLDNLKRHEALFGMMGEDWIGKFKAAGENERFGMLTRARAQVSRATPEKLNDLAAKSKSVGEESLPGRFVGSIGAGVLELVHGLPLRGFEAGLRTLSETIGRPLTQTQAPDYTPGGPVAMALEGLRQSGLVKRDPFASLLEVVRTTRKGFDDYKKQLGGARPGDNLMVSSVMSGAESAGQNLPLLAGAALAAPIVGTAAAASVALNAMGLGSGLQFFTQASDQGLGLGPTIAGSAVHGLVEKYTEKLPATKLLEGLGLNLGWRGFLRTMGAQQFQEQWTEQIATHLQDLNEWALLPENKAKTFGDYIAERPSATLQTIIATAVGTALQTGAAKGIDSAVNRAERQRNRLFFESLGQSATDSKLRQRMPERYREFVDRAAKDGPLESISIPVEQFKEYFQSQDMSPETVASELGANNYQEAILSGGDVAIPLGSFAEKIAPTAHLEGLMPDLRLANGLTEREAMAGAEEAQAHKSAILDRMAELVKEQENLAPIDAAIQEITGNVEGQLIAAGTEPKTAKDQATLMRGVAVLANRAFPDLDPLVAANLVWSHYGLIIERPAAGFEERQKLLDSFTSDPEFRSNFDDLLDIVRGGRFAETTAPTVAEMAQRLRAIGNKSGKTSRKAGVIAVRPDQAAYDKALQAEADEALAKAQQEGEEIPFDVQAVDSAELTAQAGKLAAYLKATGIDIEGKTNDQVFSLLQQEAGRALFQGGDLPGALTPFDTAEVIEARAEQAAQPLTYLIDTPARRQLRQQLADKFYGEGARRKERRVDIVIGPPAAGKSSIMVEPLAQEFGALVVDADEVKKDLPEYAAGRFAGAVHQESSNIADAIALRAIEAGDNLVLPLIGRNAERLTGMIAALKEKGYTVGLHYLELPPELSASRAVERFQETGRFVDPDYIFNRVGWTPRETYHTIKAEVDSYESYSNDVGRGEPPRLLDRSVESPAGGDGEPGSGRYPAGRLDQGDRSGESRSGPEPNRSEVTPPSQDPKAPTGAKKLFQADDNADKLGYTKILLDKKIKIGLLETADLSTFLHETGHFYLEVLGDLAAIPDSSQQLKDDYAAVLKFLKVDSRDQIETQHHEKFAQANERYLMEGEAPSPELRGVFQRFRAWLKFVYERIRKGALTTQINDQVREVFDRIYATDAEIMRVTQELGSVSMIATPEDVGWTKEQFDLYAAAVAEEVESAKERLQQQLLAEYTREQSKVWRDERKKVHEEMLAASNLMPVYLAFNDLTRGSMLAGEPVKLQTRSLIRHYGLEVVDALPKSVHASDGNLDADTAASFFGFNSGEEMLDALTNMMPQARYIVARTKEIMAQRHGDALIDGTLNQKAMDAMHNEQRLKVLRMELRALRQKVAEVEPFLEPLQEQIKQDKKERAYENRFRDAEQRERMAQARAATEVASPQAYRQVAKETMDAARPRDIAPSKYIQASRKASRAAFAAMSKGDYVEAAIQKQRELLNHYLYLEASKARDEIDKIVKYAKRFESGTTREEMARAQIGGGEYLNQIDTILNRYEFRKAPIVELDRRESLAQWIEEQRKQGIEPVIDPVLLNETRKINFASVAMTELRSIYDAIKNIEHLARLKNRLVYARKQVEFGQAKSELVSGAFENVGETVQRFSESARPLSESAKQAIQGLDAGIIKIEQLMMWLDGDRVTGPWHSYIWNPLKDAQHQLNDDTKKVVEKIDALFAKLPKEWRRGLLDRVKLDGDDVTRTRKDLIGMALNLGNAQNRTKLIDGNFGGNAAIAEQVAAKLTAEDWRFVQSTWDLIDTMWPAIAAVQKRLTGLDPVKVEATPFIARDAQGNEVAKLKGGYYPLVADRLRSTVGLKQEADIFEESYVYTNTSHGFTKERTAAKYPLDFNFEKILTHHLTQVIKDYTHREAVLAVNKILLDPEIRATLQQTLGEKYEPLFRLWLKDIANDSNRSIAEGLDTWSRIFTATRANVVAAIMGFKATTMISQVTSLGVSLDRVGPKYLTRSLLNYIAHPFETTQAVYLESGELRHRANNLDRDINLRLRAMVGKHSVKDEIQRFAFHHIAFADSITAVVTWKGAFDQSLANGQDRESAILEADAAVRLTQGAGAVMDQSAMQRSRNEFWRATTMFYSYFNALYSTGRDIGFQVDGAKDLPRALSRYFLAFVIPYILAELILLRGPDDDKDESYLPWFARKALLAPFYTVPFLRDAANAIDSGYDIRLSPMVAVVEKFSRLVGKAARDIKADRDMDFAEYALQSAEVAGYIFGVPGTAQAVASTKYAQRVSEGEERPDNLVQLLYEFGLGKPKGK